MAAERDEVRPLGRTTARAPESAAGPAAGREPAAEPRGPAPVGLSGALATAGAIAGIALIAAVIHFGAPVREQVANIRNEGEVARLAPRAGAEGDRAADVAARVEAVRTEIGPLWEAARADLEPIARSPAPPSPTLTHGLRRLERWSAFKIAWARALARHGISIEAYAREAAARPHPMDRLLVLPHSHRTR